MLFSFFGFFGGDGNAALIFSNYGSSDRLIGGVTSADISVTYAGAVFNTCLTIIIVTAICSAVAMFFSVTVSSDIISVALTLGVILFPLIIKSMFPKAVLIDNRWLKTLFTFTPVKAVSDAQTNWFRQQLVIGGNGIGYLSVLLLLLVLITLPSFFVVINGFFSKHQVK